MNNLNFGEVVALASGVPGYYQIAPGGAASAVNAAQIGTYNVGTYAVTGNDHFAIIITYSVGAFVCDTTYLPTCTGAPTITNFTDNFPGIILDVNCPQPPRCRQEVAMGGRLNFSGTEAGRWSTTITIVANYQ